MGQSLKAGKSIMLHISSMHRATSKSNNRDNKGCGNFLGLTHWTFFYDLTIFFAVIAEFFRKREAKV